MSKIYYNTAMEFIRSTVGKVGGGGAGGGGSCPPAPPPPLPTPMHDVHR